MKKFRAYKTFPDDIVGKAVKTKSGTVLLVTSLAENEISLFHRLVFLSYPTSEAFKDLTFLDGSPVGEEYEETVELVHDEVYCVRMGIWDVEKWKAQHFSHLTDNGTPVFYIDGKSEKTARGLTSSPWLCVAAYDSDLIGTIKEPKDGYLYKG